MRIYLFIMIMITNLFSALPAEIPSSLDQTPDQISNTYAETRQWLLRRVKVWNDEASLRWLFQNGDERMEDLVRALQEDSKTAFEAERIIRYLGNPSGMTAVIRRWAKQQVMRTSNWTVIPIPLCDWDYQEIENLMHKPVEYWARNDDTVSNYIFPLALDGSPKAKDYLQKIMQKTEGMRRKGHLFINHLNRVRLSDPCKLLPDAKDLIKVVKKNAFFYQKALKENVSGHIVSRTLNDDKVLLHIEMYCGMLCGSVYHVVLKREGDKWKYQSVTLVAES